MPRNPCATSAHDRFPASLEGIESRYRTLLRELAQQSTQRRRAAGVYYTPRCVAGYIVRDALAPLLSDTAPGQAARLKILDPACGAGSFLLETYRFLLDWHRQRYIDDGPEPWTQGRTPCLCRLPEGDWQLTPAERQRILVENVFGVDVDPQAVEAARLALVLEMLGRFPDQPDRAKESLDPLESYPPLPLAGEGQRVRGRRREFEIHGETPRPSIAAQCLEQLSTNLQCGDALLGPIAGMPDGGFEAVLGNPPYRRERGSKVLLESLSGTPFGGRYRSARMDLWYYFVHRGLELLRPGGVLSYIVSAYWTAGAGAERLVAALRDEAHLDEVFLLGDLPVFPGVAGRHMIVRLTKARSLRPTTIRRVPPGSMATVEDLMVGQPPAIAFRKSSAQLFRGNRLDLEPEADAVLAKIERWPGLGELGLVRQGIAENPAAINARTNAAFGNRWQVGQGVFALRPDEVEGLALSREERALVRPYFDLCDVTRYGIAAWPSLGLLYLTRETCPDLDRHPRLKAHLERFRPIMEARRETRNGRNCWWHLHWPRDETLWHVPKIVCLQFARRPAFVPVRQEAYVPFSMNVFVPSDGTRESLEYLCGLLNSRVIWKWHLHHAKRRGVGLEINGRVLARTPIRRIDFSRPVERRRHDQVAALAQTMLALVRQQNAARPATAQTALSAEMEAADRRLDRLVYDLYGLTGEEIAQVEGAVASA